MKLSMIAVVLNVVSKCIMLLIQCTLTTSVLCMSAQWSEVQVDLTFEKSVILCSAPKILAVCLLHLNRR